MPSQGRSPGSLSEPGRISPEFTVFIPKNRDISRNLDYGRREIKFGVQISSGGAKKAI